jgi:curved DNA-binding protein CbpA
MEGIDMTMTHYDILGIEQTATLEEIKAAFKVLAKKYHPDINPKTAEKFKKINEAYSILTNPLERRKYDESLQGDDLESIFKNATEEELDDFIRKMDEINRKLKENADILNELNKEAEPKPVTTKDRIISISKKIYRVIANISSFIYKFFKYVVVPATLICVSILYFAKRFFFSNNH